MHEDKTHEGPLVSVVMPVYNVERFLDQAIDSILRQDYPNLELIAIDDGSTDSSGRILDEYGSSDRRIRVVHQSNQGVVAAANKGIALAKGEYIARQDSDDISFRSRIGQQVALLEKHADLELVTGSFEGFDEDDEFIYREILPADDDDIKRALYLRNPIGHGSTMFRKRTLEEIGGYGANGDTRGLAEDYELFLRLAKRGRFQALEGAMYRWRINTKGLTSTHNKLMADITKEHINDIWAGGCPKVLGTRELRRRGNRYWHTYKKRGVAMKQVLLADNAQLGIRMIKHGFVLNGIRQLLAVLLVGRSGLHAVHMRFRYIRKGTAAAVRRKMWFSS
jgi:glycosyltransferase involved in cell wall biosynthesis